VGSSPTGSDIFRVFSSPSSNLLKVIISANVAHQIMIVDCTNNKISSEQFENLKISRSLYSLVLYHLEIKKI